MGIYKKMYLKLFNSVTDAINALRRADSAEAKRLLTAAQRECEELFMNAGDTQPDYSVDSESVLSH